MSNLLEIPMLSGPFPNFSAENKVLGILGGMGPSATLLFMEKILELTPATKDQDHIPMLISSIPQIPDRTLAWEGKAIDPLPMLKKHLERLEAAGATLFVMSCNTVHYWYEPLKATANIDSLSMIDVVVARVKKMGLKRVGLLATDGTLGTHLYQMPLLQLDVETLLPLPNEQEKVMRGIRAIKAGRLDLARGLFQDTAERLEERGAEVLILGCTEIPLVLKPPLQNIHIPLIDSLQELAQACVDWYFADRLSEYQSNLQ